MCPVWPDGLWEEILCFQVLHGSDPLLTFLLCDQAHQDPDGVLIGILSPIGRVHP